MRTLKFCKRFKRRKDVAKTSNRDAAKGIKRIQQGRFTSGRSLATCGAPKGGCVGHFGFRIVCTRFDETAARVFSTLGDGLGQPAASNICRRAGRRCNGVRQHDEHAYTKCNWNGGQEGADIGWATLLLHQQAQNLLLPSTRGTPS